MATEVPAVRVVGVLVREMHKNDENARYLVRTGWSGHAIQVSGRGLKVLRSLEIQILDDPLQDGDCLVRDGTAQYTAKSTH